MACAIEHAIEGCRLLGEATLQRATTHRHSLRHVIDVDRTVGGEILLEDALHAERDIVGRLRGAIEDLTRVSLEHAAKRLVRRRKNMPRGRRPEDEKIR